MSSTTFIFLLLLFAVIWFDFVTQEPTCHNHTCTHRRLRHQIHALHSVFCWLCACVWGARTNRNIYACLLRQHSYLFNIFYSNFWSFFMRSDITYIEANAIPFWYMGHGRATFVCENNLIQCQDSANILWQINKKNDINDDDDVVGGGKRVEST